MSADTLPKLLLEASKKWADKVALRQKDFGIWQEITWKEYLEHVRYFGMGLAKLGLQPGTKVCIEAENTQEWVYSDLAIQSMGGITVGIYPTNPAEEVHYIMDNCDGEFFIAEDEEHLEKILAVKDRLPKLKKIIVFNTKGLNRYRCDMIIGYHEVEEIGRKFCIEQPDLFEQSVKQGKADDEAVIIYTSGTTGHPKGAIHTQRSMIESVQCMQTVLQLNGKDTTISYLPLCHAIERIISICLHLICGTTVHFGESIDSIQRDVREIAPTVFFTVPRILERMQAEINIKMNNSTVIKRKVFNWCFTQGRILAQKEMKGKLSPVDSVKKVLVQVLVQNPIKQFTGFKRARWIAVGGAAVSSELLWFLRALGINARELFGMTETFGVSVMQTEAKFEIGNTGKPYPGVEVKIAEDGEMLFLTPGAFKGYYKMPEATAEVKRDGWVYSGDLGELDSNGCLRITGRKKDIIITSGGKNVSPQVIENVLKESPYIREALIIGDGRKFISALVQIETDVVGNWAQSQGIAYTTLRDLSSRPEVISLIEQEVEKANSKLNRVEKIKKTALIDKELYHEEGDVTATQKMRRSVMEQKFKYLIEPLYNSNNVAG
ncbi:MAG: AMP-binding protein [Thermincola sp.]|nr:AMP-binding protein [Thermincola sp.]MDT3704567.1 AMP-binding protein [Thermincola sp.]